MNTQELVHSIKENLKGIKIENVSTGSEIDSKALDSIFEKVGVLEKIEILKQRQFLRVTAFPGCNLRCSYCNPEGAFGKEVLSTVDSFLVFANCRIADPLLRSTKISFLKSMLLGNKSFRH